MCLLKGRVEPNLYTVLILYHLLKRGLKTPKNIHLHSGTLNANTNLKKLQQTSPVPTAPLTHATWQNQRHSISIHPDRQPPRQARFVGIQELSIFRFPKSMARAMTFPSSSFTTIAAKHIVSPATHCTMLSSQASSAVPACQLAACHTKSTKIPRALRFVHPSCFSSQIDRDWRRGFYSLNGKKANFRLLPDRDLISGSSEAFGRGPKLLAFIGRG
ncbi:hypothetical protein HDK77DRAFT_193854 [Phyllosticta capitalensis]